ncbi:MULTISPECIES: hypothetical protein [Cryobacterium]|uniref:DUF4328 domain-containing protein n=1 Tax=Cryobacterium breve TaxID=1259258 RepID=A0ABY2J4H1_9MICO|nr:MULTISPECIES: hypothetical protein [Cryobacterium]TFC92029.1 hypothetical protein E3T20_11990 [Cryobacterium sp. TmT3-12]TFC99832.1 hypothetical protein E3O65_05515 [Cryobacterium breve]
MTDLFVPIHDRAIAYIRTFVPLVIGSALGWALLTFTWLGDFLSSAATFLPPDVSPRVLLNAAATAAVIALYYWGARQLGKRWPKAEKWLLGSSAVPTYTAKHTA